MLERRLPLLWAFAGGCFSGVVLLGLWRTELALPAPSAHPAFNRRVDERSEPGAKKSKLRERERADATSDDNAETEDEPAEDAPANGHARHAANTDAPATKTDEAAVAEGSSVADVLTQLETAYRERLASTKPTSANRELAALDKDAPDVERGSAPPRTTTVADAPAREVGTREVAARDEPTAALAAPAPELAAPAPAPRSAPVALAPAPEAPVAEMPAEMAGVTLPAPSPLPAEAAERLAASGVAQPRDVYFGNVQNNVYLGNVYQGQVVQAEQQLALLQYMQLLSLSPYGRVGGRGRGLASVPLAAVPRALVSPSTRTPAIQTQFTNPDNPWGFDFPPTNYVK